MKTGRSDRGRSPKLDLEADPPLSGAAPKGGARADLDAFEGGGSGAGQKVGAAPGPIPVGAGVRAELDRVLDALWTRRHDIALQPHPGAAWLAVSEGPPLERIEVGPDTYLRGLLELAMARPAGAPTHSGRCKDFDTLRGRIREAMRGEVRWSGVARDTFFFDRAGVDPTEVKEQVFLHVPPQHVPKVLEALLDDVLDAPRAHPGVLRIQVARPYDGNPGNIVIGTRGGEDTERLMTVLRKLQKRSPEHFRDGVPPLAATRLSGVAVGEVPARERYPDEDFRSVRTQVLHGVACEAAQRGLDKAAFTALFEARWREAGLDLEAPSKNDVGAVQALPDEVVPLPGAIAVEAGAFEVQVPGFDGEPRTVEIEISDEVAANMGRRKGVRFLPEQGLFARVDVDRTRNPPHERVKRQFVAAFVDDTRFRLDFGRRPPPFVHFDKATQSYHVPEKVRLSPIPRGVYGNYELDITLDPERPGLDRPGQALLMEKLNDPEVQGARLEKVMSRVDGYVRDAGAQVSQRVVLEEGTNGVSVVSLSNRAQGVWKPSAAEYPEQARENLEPDHQARREAFAYFISKHLGHLGRVPPTVFRELDGEPGAISALSRGTLPGSHCGRLDEVLADPADPVYRDLAVFDCVIGNLDRHSGNILFKGPVAFAIDHGLAFPLEHGAQGEMNYIFAEDVPLSDAHRAALEGLLADSPAVRAEAERLGMAPEAVARLFERVRRMLDLGRTFSDWRGGEA